MRPLKLTLAGKAILVVSLFVLTAIGVDAYKYIVTSEFLSLSQRYAERYERAHNIQIIRSELDHAATHSKMALDSQVYQLHLAEELSRAYRRTDDILHESDLIPEESRRLRELRASIRKLFSPSVTGEIDDNYRKQLQATSSLAKDLYDLEGRQLAADNAALENDIARINELVLITSSILILLALGLGFWLIRMVSGRIMRITRSARNILKSHGDVIDIDVTGDDEVGELARVLTDSFRAVRDARRNEGRSESERSGTLNSLAIVRATINDATHSSVDDIAAVTLARLESIPEVQYAIGFIFKGESDYDLVIGGSLALNFGSKPAKTLERANIAEYAGVSGIRFESPEASGKLSDWTDSEGFPVVDSLALVPLGHEPHAHGLLVLGCRRPLADENAAVAEASAFAMDFALREMRNERTVESIQTLLTLFDTVTELPLEALRCDNELKPILRRVALLMRMDSIAVFLCPSGKPVLKSYWNEGRRRDARTDEWSLLAYNVISAGKTLDISDLSASPFFATAEARMSTRAVLAAPLAINDEVLGALQLHSEEVRSFSDADRRLIEVFAERLAFALAKDAVLGKLSVFTAQQSGLLDSLALPIILIDPVGKIIATSSGARKLIDADDTNVSKLAINDVLTQESAVRLFAEIEKTKDSHTTLVLTFNATDERRELEMDIHVVVDDGEFMGVQLVGRTDGWIVPTISTSEINDA